MLIPNVETKTYRNQNLQKASGASYELTNGELSGNKLRFSGATIQKVSQRYTTTIVAKNELGTLELDALEHTTDWEALKGSNNSFSITGLEPGQLDYRKSTATVIRNAVSREAKSKRLNRQTIQKWEQSVRNIRTVNQKPLSVVLRSVMWKLEGKDAAGKAFQKQIRIDMPI